MRKVDRLGGESTPSFVNISDCTAKTGLSVDLEAREYKKYKMVRYWTSAQFDEYVKAHPESAAPLESQTIDTGESKFFFGRSAKHLITTTKQPRSQKGDGGQEIIDGWYIDHDRPDNNCVPDYAADQLQYLVGTVLIDDYRKVPRFHHIGPLPTGLPVEHTRNITYAPSDNRRVRSVILEEKVEDLSDGLINPLIFEIPSGYRENPRLGQNTQPGPSNPQLIFMWVLIALVVAICSIARLKGQPT